MTNVDRLAELRAGASRTALAADALMLAQDGCSTLPSLATRLPGFDVEEAYGVLAEIERRRMAQGWRRVGAKIGFTNRTIWPRYGVYRPMVASVWSHSVQRATGNAARVSLRTFVQPRIEPEVVFGLGAGIAPGGDARAVLDASAWIAAGFEIVQSHFPGWKLTAADCTAAFGLHAALVIGTPLPLTTALRAALVDVLPRFEVMLRRAGTVIDRGIGANVLDSPALAVVHAAEVLAAHPALPQLQGGDVITTGTVTDAWPVLPGETWTSDYGELPVAGLTLAFD